MKKLFNLLKKIVFAFFLIYGFNMLYGTFKMNIPLNVYTVLFTSILGFPGFLAIIFVNKLLF